MLDKLFESIDGKYPMDAFFQGLAFKFEKGILIVDKYFDDVVEDGFAVEWVSFNDIEPAQSAVLVNEEELEMFIKEVVM